MFIEIFLGIIAFRIAGDARMFYNGIIINLFFRYEEGFNKVQRKILFNIRLSYLGLFYLNLLSII
jgi:hypothetical protein